MSVSLLANAERLYLEVVVLVDGASGVRGHISHCCQVHILAGKEEKIHTAALCHTVLRQLLVRSFLRLEQSLERNRVPTEKVSLVLTFLTLNVRSFNNNVTWLSTKALTHLLFFSVDQLFVVPVLQFAGRLGGGHGGVENEELPAAFCCLKDGR